MKWILLIALVLSIGCNEPDIVRLMKMEDNLYRVNIKLKDGKELSSLVQEISENDTTIILSKIHINKSGEPGIFSVVFNKRDLSKFEYKDVRDSIIFYKN